MGYRNHEKRGRQIGLGRPLPVARPQALFKSSSFFTTSGICLTDETRQVSLYIRLISLYLIDLLVTVTAWQIMEKRHLSL